MSPKSAIYEGKVRHRRFQPVPNTFRYRLFLMYLDLDVLLELFAPFRFWLYGRRNIASFRREDYLGDAGLPLDAAVRRLVEKRTGQRTAGPIRMLSHLRYFGYCFNPVTFYYCFDEPGTNVETIVAEINNTPWMERHQYVLDASLNRHSSLTWRRYRLSKEFHTPIERKLMLLS